MNRENGQCITDWSFTRRHTRGRQLVKRHKHDTTPRGSRSSLAKTRAKAARLAQQKRQAERVVLERQKLRAEVQLDETDAQLVHQKEQVEVKLKQQCTYKRTM